MGLDVRIRLRRPASSRDTAPTRPTRGPLCPKRRPPGHAAGDHRTLLRCIVLFVRAVRIIGNDVTVQPWLGEHGSGAHLTPGPSARVAQRRARSVVWYLGVRCRSTTTQGLCACAPVGGQSGRGGWCEAYRLQSDTNTSSHVRLVLGAVVVAVSPNWRPPELWPRAQS